MTATSPEYSQEYPSEYHRMVVTGLVDHKWAARLQRAATPPGSEETVAQVLADRGFSSNRDLEEALAHIDWAAIRAVAQAFDPEGRMDVAIIC
jgi:hypothetical protein